MAWLWSEEGAEAIALALSGACYGWSVERRLQSRAAGGFGTV